MTEAVIATKDLYKTYHMGEVEVNALQKATFEIHKGELVAITGPSGSGKSTLMNIIGCLDSPTGGDYFLDGMLVSKMHDDELAQVRNQKIGFIFQSFNLLPRITALQNVELPMRYAGVASNRTARAREALEKVGLGTRVNHRPTELSGGQQQRVAIARALINNPSILLADEPTGNLDSKSGKDIMAMILSLNQELGMTVIIVTHDPNVAAQTRRVIYISDGVVAEGAEGTE